MVWSGLDEGGHAVRVIAGSLKGRQLHAPTWAGLRPSSDRLRETLFNILGDRVRDASVLDAYAGTGALGIEALSRGARNVVFVDRDRRATKLIADNLERCGVAAHGRVVCGALPGVANDVLAQVLDLVLLDPPYDDPQIDAILSAVAPRVAPEGVLVLERARRSTPHAVTGLTHTRRVRSGDSVLDFYHLDEGPPD